MTNTERDGRLSVLVVEDDADTSAMLTLLIESKGHYCAVAHDASTALSALDTRPWDVVVIDIGLPKTSGHELARRIRLTVGSTIRLIAATGYGSDLDREQSRASGFDALLLKPLDFDELLREIAAVRPGS